MAVMVAVVVAVVEEANSTLQTSQSYSQTDPPLSLHIGSKFQVPNYDVMMIPLLLVVIVWIRIP